jgi:hypothetical protein
VLEHARELRTVPLDVHVLERNVPPFILLTGGEGVGSRVLPENVHHGAPPPISRTF